MQTPPSEHDNERATNMTLVLEQAGFDFNRYDVNQDGMVSPNELAILVFANDTIAWGGQRKQYGGCTLLRKSPLNVCSLVVLAGQQPAFDLLTHELSHLLGTKDIYSEGPGGCMSMGLSVMSCSGETPDAKTRVYLDPWHRAQLGWLTPVSASFPYEMGDETWVSARAEKSRPAMIPNPLNLNEYYLFEYRGRRGYDSEASDFGIVAWHVTEDGNGNLVAGNDGFRDGIHAVGPDNNFGSRMAWSSASPRHAVRFQRARR